MRHRTFLVDMENLKVTIANVSIDNVSMDEAVDIILAFTATEGKKFVSTPNLDFLYNASKNENFRRVLNGTSLNVPDGMPLILLSRIQGKPLKEKVSGATLFLNLCEMASRHGKSIYLLGSAEGVAIQAKNILETKYKGLDIVGATSPSFGFEKNMRETKALVRKINEVAPDILMVGVGAPKQELWISNNIDQLKIKVAIGVGASIDFAAGKMRIPPAIVKRIGFAWFWRLLNEPRRLGRRYIVNDLPFFIKLLYVELRKLLLKQGGPSQRK